MTQESPTFQSGWNLMAGTVIGQNVVDHGPLVQDLRYLSGSNVDASVWDLNNLRRRRKTAESSHLCAAVSTTWHLLDF
jgi:hypothetical protein